MGAEREVTAPNPLAAVIPEKAAVMEEHSKKRDSEIPSSNTATLTGSGGNATPSSKFMKNDPYGSNVPPATHDAHKGCTLCHIPYGEISVPFPTSLIKCCSCKRARVPDLLFMTIEPPPNLPITGTGCVIQARVCRSKRDSKGEHCAKEISDVRISPGSLT